MLQVNLSGYENITVFLAPSVVSDWFSDFHRPCVCVHRGTHGYKQKYLHQVFYWKHHLPSAHTFAKEVTSWAPWRCHDCCWTFSLPWLDAMQDRRGQCGQSLGLPRTSSPKTPSVIQGQQFTRANQLIQESCDLIFKTNGDIPVLIFVIFFFKYGFTWVLFLQKECCILMSLSLLHTVRTCFYQYCIQCV